MKTAPPAPARALEPDEAAAAPPPAMPVSQVVAGAGAHDPLAHAELAEPAAIDLETWLAAKGMRRVLSAGFSSWAPAGKRPAQEWADLFVKFQQTPIR